jgi:hypothetical protein
MRGDSASLACGRNTELHRSSSGASKMNVQTKHRTLNSTRAARRVIALHLVVALVAVAIVACRCATTPPEPATAQAKVSYTLPGPFNDAEPVEFADAGTAWMRPLSVTAFVSPHIVSATKPVEDSTLVVSFVYLSTELGVNRIAVHVRAFDEQRRVVVDDTQSPLDRRVINRTEPEARIDGIRRWSAETAARIPVSRDVLRTIERVVVEFSTD